MARVTKRETYPTESSSEILSQAKLSAQEQVSKTENSSGNIEVAASKNDTGATIKLANAKRMDEQFQATLLKGQLHDTASRLDGFQDGELKGFEKEAKKFGIEDLGVIKDNLGKEIVRHEGPGIDDMYKKSKKYEMPDRDPLKGLPKTQKMEKDNKKAPEMPLKDDPKLVSGGGMEHYNKAGREGVGQLFGYNKGGGENPPPKEMSKGEKMTEVWKILKDSGVMKAGEDAIKKAKDGGTKYSDPDQIDAAEVEKPKTPPPTKHDLLGHKVNPLNHDPVIDTENVDIKKVVAEHKGPPKALIYTDPEQTQKEAKFDPTNPPRIEENELKNTGNPNDFYATQFELPKGGGDKPHTDGEGGDGETHAQQIKAGTFGASGEDKVKPFGGQSPMPTEGDDDDDDGVGPNIPK